VNLRLKGRFVLRQTILDAVDSYEIVESYPDDKYLPSYLVLARLTYRPSLDEWEDDLKTRRARP
jgi:hypothetical protein